MTEGALKKEQKDQQVKGQISYELLRLKYVKCLLAGDNVTALFLLRNELAKYPEHFLEEQKDLSRLFLCKDKKELVKESGLDVNNRLFLEDFLKGLEQRGHSEEGDPFEEWVRRYLGYEVLTCGFHRPNSHSLIGKGGGRVKLNGNSKCIKNGNEDGQKEEKVAKTKKISKKETESLAKRERKRKRSKHHCWPATYNLETKQVLDNPKDQVWRVKFSPDGKFIVAATKSNLLYCWKKK